MNEIIGEAENFIAEHYKSKIGDEFSFHSLKHVSRMVKAANEIAEHQDIGPSDLEIINIAAWFHDSGHAVMYEGHEDASAKLAEEFLKSRNYDADNTKKVLACIRATNLKATPKNNLEEIMRDADILHLGKKSFAKRNKELRREWEKILDKKFSDKEWLESDLQFFLTHDFYTEYAKSQYDKQKLINMAAIQENLDRLGQGLPAVVADNLTEKADTKKPIRVKTPDRGIETMFRLTSKNHFTLSSIADSKAGTLISISALIISIILSVLVRRLAEEPQLIIPTIMLLLTLMGTIIFSVLSTRPKITSFRLSREDIEERRGNLLFFGNFINMPVEDYEWGMKEVMNDREYLYNNLIRDIYYLGVVLGKKYRFLRIAYDTFMYGLVISVIAYIIAFAVV